MLKKLTFVVCALMLTLAVLTGCAKGEKGAEKFVEKYYKDYISGKINPSDVYDNYISDLSKDLLGISKADYVSSVEAKEESGFKFKSYEISSVTNYEDSIYKVRVYLEIELGGETTKQYSDEYVINENGKYKFLQYGVQNKQSIETNFTSNDFSMTIDTLYTGPDKIMVNLIAKNNTTSPYAVGFGGNGKIVVETDKGRAEAVLPGTNVVRPMDDLKGLQEITDVKGTINTITIYNIYELNASNEPKSKNNARSFVLYQAK